MSAKKIGVCLPTPMPLHPCNPLIHVIRDSDPSRHLVWPNVTFLSHKNLPFNTYSTVSFYLHLNSAFKPAFNLHFNYLRIMYSREEASRIKHEFWTTLGRYMSPIPSAEGIKVNWVNYHTRLKDVYFRMDAVKKSAMISISLEHSDPDMQQLYFEQFLEMKDMLHAALGEEWDWRLHGSHEDGRVISRIYKEISDVSVFNKHDWPDLISFFKPRIIALDSFWENAKYGFEGLRG